jgi:hypothetical protein
MSPQFMVQKALDIPAGLFNDDGLAGLGIQGTAASGGHWLLVALRASRRQPEGNWGEILTSCDLPDTALEAAFAWLNEEAQRHGWRLVMWDNQNSRLPDGMKPFLAVAQAVLANDKFVPAPGVAYADETPSVKSDGSTNRHTNGEMNDRCG